eukprot:g959.t1
MDWERPYLDLPQQESLLFDYERLGPEGIQSHRHARIEREKGLSNYTNLVELVRDSHLRLATVYHSLERMNDAWTDLNIDKDSSVSLNQLIDYVEKFWNDLLPFGGVHSVVRDALEQTLFGRSLRGSDLVDVELEEKLELTRSDFRIFLKNLLEMSEKWVILALRKGHKSYATGKLKPVHKDRKFRMKASSMKTLREHLLSSRGTSTRAQSTMNIDKDEEMFAETFDFTEKKKKRNREKIDLAMEFIRIATSHGVTAETIWYFMDRDRRGHVNFTQFKKGCDMAGLRLSEDAMDEYFTALCVAPSRALQYRHFKELAVPRKSLIQKNFHGEMVKPFFGQSPDTKLPERDSIKFVVKSALGYKYGGGTVVGDIDRSKCRGLFNHQWRVNRASYELIKSNAASERRSRELVRSSDVSLVGKSSTFIKRQQRKLLNRLIFQLRRHRVSCNRLWRCFTNAPNNNNNTIVTFRQFHENAAEIFHSWNPYPTQEEMKSLYTYFYTISPEGKFADLTALGFTYFQLKEGLKRGGFVRLKRKVFLTEEQDEEARLLENTEKTVEDENGDHETITPHRIKSLYERTTSCFRNLVKQNEDSFLVVRSTATEAAGYKVDVDKISENEKEAKQKIVKRFIHFLRSRSYTSISDLFNTLSGEVHATAVTLRRFRKGIHAIGWKPLPPDRDLKRLFQSFDLCPDTGKLFFNEFRIFLTSHDWQRRRKREKLFLLSNMNRDDCFRNFTLNSPKKIEDRRAREDRILLKKKNDEKLHRENVELHDKTKTKELKAKTEVAVKMQNLYRAKKDKPNESLTVKEALKMKIIDSIKWSSNDEKDELSHLISEMIDCDAEEEDIVDAVEASRKLKQNNTQNNKL